MTYCVCSTELLSFGTCVSATLRGYSKSRGVLAVPCVTYYPRGNTPIAASFHLCGGDGGW